jgi:2-polyprenyl-6-methoxyphenol hydroxylase-like FAD-dependent oxidoreductase
MSGYQGIVVGNLRRSTRVSHTETFPHWICLHSHSKPRICVIGGGIGGVAAGVALTRAGLDATVYERAAELREIGSGLCLWPNATRALRELGLLDDVLARAEASSHFMLRTRSGRVLMSLGVGGYDVPAVCMHRTDLLATLLARLPDDRIRLGHELESVQQDRGEKVVVAFTNGVREEFDGVIGADGIHSRVRETLFGPAEPLDRGYTICRGVSQYHGDLIRRGYNSETWGTGNRFGILAMGDGRYTWYATSNASLESFGTPAQRRQELLRIFDGWHEPIPQLIAATPIENIFPARACDGPELRQWGKGSITLLGDAAHACTPNLGQGCAMALEDVVTLAKCVAGTFPIASGAFPISDAFRRYEAMRQRRARRLTQRSHLVGQIGQWENHLLVAVREAVTALLSPRLLEYNLSRVYSHQV